MYVNLEILMNCKGNIPLQLINISRTFFYSQILVYVNIIFSFTRFGSQSL